MITVPVSCYCTPLKTRTNGKLSELIPLLFLNSCLPKNFINQSNAHFSLVFSRDMNLERALLHKKMLIGHYRDLQSLMHENSG